MTNAQGKAADFTYDTKNNLTSATLFGTPICKWNLAWNTEQTSLLSISDPLGNQTVRTYDSSGRILSITDPEGRRWSFGYDAAGNRASTTDPLGRVTAFGHDAVGRLTSVTDALDETTTFAYDANDNRISVTDARSHATTLTYDDNDNLETISYVRSGITDTITYAYDSNDCLWTETDPNGGAYQYAYDSAGNVSSRVDPNASTTTYLYDPQGRLTRKTDQGTSDFVTYAYDLNGNLTGMDESYLAGSHTFVYDELNRLTSHTNTFGVTLGYGYDDASNRTSVVYPGVGTVQYAYDLANRLETATDWTSAAVSHVHDGSGALTGVVHPNGVVTQYGYDRARRMTAITHRRSDATAFASYVAMLDAVGNRKSVTALPTLSVPQPTAGSTTYTIGKDNRLLAESGAISYGHDSNGNRTSRTVGATTTTYTYDFENRLIQISDPTSTVQYTYDGLGNRISQQLGGVTTRFVLDLSGSRSEVLAETDASNTAGAYYVYARGLTAQITPGGQRYAYHFDSLGSTVGITDAAENLVNRYAYRAFGGVADEQTSLPNPFKYVGRHGVMEEADGLYFMRARYYDPSSGRFLSKDPIGFEGGDWNLYAYVGANPVNRSDPRGLSDLPNDNAYWTGIGTVAGDVVSSGGRAIPVSPIAAASFVAELTETQMKIYESRRADIENLAGLVADGEMSLDDAMNLLLRRAGLMVLWRRSELRYLLSSRILSMLQARR